MASEPIDVGSLVGTPKPPCEFPLPDGRRCAECASCHPTPEEQAAWLATPEGQAAMNQQGE